MKQGIFMRAMEADAKEAIIDVVGVIGWEVWYGQMRDMLKAIPDTVERVVFDIYSPGGDIWEGNAIIQQIGALKQNTVARVQVAASMATSIAVACKEREIASNGRFLIHNPWAALAGDAATLEKRAKELRDCEVEAAKFYAARTGQTVEAMTALMAEERWLTPEETKELGFVQTINDPFDTAQYADVKAAIVAAGKWPQALVEIPETETPEDKPSEDANTAGAAGNVETPTDASIKPDDGSDEYKAGVTVGIAQGEIARAELTKKHQEQIASRDKRISEMQSMKDKAEAQIVVLGKQIADLTAGFEQKTKTLEQCLADANVHISKLLGGGLTFMPAPVETWEEALVDCRNDYVEAARKYPALKQAFIEKNRRK